MPARHADQAVFQEVFEFVGVVNSIKYRRRFRHVDKADDEREERQNQQRQQHRPIALRRLFSRFAAWLIKEDQHNLPPHIKGGERGGDQQYAKCDKAAQFIQFETLIPGIGRISSFDQKPAKGKIPASASIPIK